MAKQVGYAEALSAPRPSKPGAKKLKGLNIELGDKGGHTVTPRYEHSDGPYREEKPTIFGAREGKQLVAHLVKHAGIKMGGALLVMALCCAAAFGQIAPLSTTITGTGCTVPTLIVDRMGSVGISVQNMPTGSAWSGTIQAQISIGGDAFANVNARSYTSPVAGTITSSGYYKVRVDGAMAFQLCGNTVTNTAQIKVNFFPGISVDDTQQVSGSGSVLASSALGILATPAAGSNQSTLFSSQAALTTAVVVKNSTGNLYGLQVTNGAASVCYLEFINAASAPTLGTAAQFSFAVPASGTLTIPIGFLAMDHFAAGISVGMATTYNGSVACGTAASAVIFYF